VNGYVARIVIFSTLTAIAPTAYAQMTPTGGGYVNFSSDGSNVFVTSYASTNAIGSAGTYPNCYHHLQASVTVTAGASGNSDGTAVDQVHAYTSGSVRQDDSYGLTGSDVSLHTNYQAWCDCGGGTFVNSSDDWLVSLKRSQGKNTGGSQVVTTLRFCGMTSQAAYCNDGVTPACDHWTTIKSANDACNPDENVAFLKVSHPGSSEYSCIGLTWAVPGGGQCDSN
jgi:hypothetical protein